MIESVNTKGLQRIKRVTFPRRVVREGGTAVNQVYHKTTGAKKGGEKGGKKRGALIFMK